VAGSVGSLRSRQAATEARVVMVSAEDPVVLVAPVAVVVMRVEVVPAVPAVQAATAPSWHVSRSVVWREVPAELVVTEALVDREVTVVRVAPVAAVRWDTAVRRVEARGRMPVTVARVASVVPEQTHRRRAVVEATLVMVAPVGMRVTAA
jgi:hypothetical protein